MKKLLLLLLALSSQIGQAEDVVATRCHDQGQKYKTHGTCWGATFRTEKGALVSTKVATKVVNRSAGTLGPSEVLVEINYRDDKNFFANAAKLYPYVTVLKTTYPNQGHATISSNYGMREMVKTKDGFYQARFRISLNNKKGEFQEFVSGVKLAFTAVYPHSGEAKWDSANHRNHGAWFR